MARRRRIVLASRNPGKVREIRAVLAGADVEIVGLEELDPDRRIPEPAEDGETFADNARAKAACYAAATGCWALADDSGLAIDALDGAPGVRSARYAADRCPPGAPREQIDRANNDRCLRELAGVPDERRGASFTCHLCLSDRRGVLLEAIGVVEGRIARAPRGENGFGYDPLFFVPELGCSMAELAPHRKNEISHRGRAARRFARLLGEMLRAGGD